MPFSFVFTFTVQPRTVWFQLLLVIVICLLLEWIALFTLSLRRHYCENQVPRPFHISYTWLFYEVSGSFPGPAALSFLTATTSTWPCLPCVLFHHLCELPSPERAAVLQPDINNPSSNSGSGCPVFLASVGAWGFTWFKLQKSFLYKEWVEALECLKFLYFILFLQI